MAEKKKKYFGAEEKSAKPRAKRPSEVKAAADKPKRKYTARKPKVLAEAQGQALITVRIPAEHAFAVGQYIGGLGVKVG